MQQMMTDAQSNEKKALSGHLGTHFDVMDKEFPLEYTSRKGIVFDVSHVGNRDITVCDIVPEKVEANMFVAFYTGYMEKEPYGTKTYFTDHPQLSEELVELLLGRKISIIGIDCAGIRRGREHTKKDQYCADAGVFVVENLTNLGRLARHKEPDPVMHTYPMKYEGMTGLPCRVVAQIED